MASTKDSSTPNTIGERIAKKRRERGLSQQQLADMNGVTRSLIGQIEGNQSKPSIEFMTKMVSITGTTYEYIIEGRPERPFDVADTLELNRLYTQIVWIIELREKAFGKSPGHEEYLDVLVKRIEPYGVKSETSPIETQTQLQSMLPKLIKAMRADFDELFHRYFLDMNYSRIVDTVFNPPKNVISLV
ncbi:MAG: helix-turn-helix transcriptional regulator [Cyclobacteriaceae bacterium]|nr:helix-turn-helix transcriptional regulator [Cyclobacteriaceae bacterium]